MDQIKIKKCSVKLNRLSFIGVNPDEIQEQILDQRVRKCSVRVQRCIEPPPLHMCQAMTSSNGGQPMRRCFIRLPRLNMVRSDLSSPVASVVSGHLHSETEELETKTIRTKEWVEKYGPRKN